MTTIQIIEKLVELQEARIASGDVDQRCCELILDLSTTYITEQAALSKTLDWLVRDTQTRFDRDQGMPNGKGSYSPELKIAITLLNR